MGMMFDWAANTVGAGIRGVPLLCKRLFDNPAMKRARMKKRRMPTCSHPQKRLRRQT
jgi:hypothetical protein